MIHPTLKLAPLVLLMAVSASTASAVNIVVTAQTNDRQIHQNGTSKNNDTMRVGLSNTEPAAVVMGFRLPDLQPNEFISAVAFSIGYHGQSNDPVGSVDMHGLGARGSSAVQAADFHMGPLPEEDPGALMLVDNFLDASTASGIATTDGMTGASTSLTDYLNSLYTAGVPNNTFAMFRLAIDSPSEANSHFYTVSSADHLNSERHPTLAITVVPEPSTTAGIIGAAALGLVFVRRKMMRVKQE